MGKRFEEGLLIADRDRESQAQKRNTRNAETTRSGWLSVVFGAKEERAKVQDCIVVELQKEKAKNEEENSFTANYD